MKAHSRQEDVNPASLGLARGREYINQPAGVYTVQPTRKV